MAQCIYILIIFIIMYMNRDIRKDERRKYTDSNVCKLQLLSYMTVRY